MDTDTQRCTKCEKTKPLSDFYRHGTRKNGHRPDCKDCADQAARTWWTETNQRLRRHHITQEQFEAILRNQDGMCRNCAGGLGNWRLDHDKRCCPGQYSCGNCIRGILCVRCNGDVEAVLRNRSRLPEVLTYLDSRVDLGLLAA